MYIYTYTYCLHYILIFLYLSYIDSQAVFSINNWWLGSSPVTCRDKRSFPPRQPKWAQYLWGISVGIDLRFAKNPPVHDVQYFVLVHIDYIILYIGSSIFKSFDFGLFWDTVSVEQERYLGGFSMRRAELLWIAHLYETL